MEFSMMSGDGIEGLAAADKFAMGGVIATACGISTCGVTAGSGGGATAATVLGGAIAVCVELSQ